MADEILSIDTDTLDGIANAIRNKGGLPQSNKLSFPDGMVAALQNIETVATVTPKISPPSTKELTPSDTSFALEPGYHTNGTTVLISTTTGSATPSSTEQTYYPQSPYNFFSSFWVDGTGNGYKVKTGTVQVSDTKIEIPNLDFTPVGLMLCCARNSEKVNKNIFCAQHVPTTYTYIDMAQYGSGGSVLAGHTTNQYKDTLFNFEYGKATFDAGSSVVRGTYFYMTWGN